MQQLQFHEFTVNIKRSGRKTVGLYYMADGTVELRCPAKTPQCLLEEVLSSNLSWLRKKRANAPAPRPTLTEGQLKELADRAVQQLPPLVDEFARRIGVRYSRLTVRRQRTRWGSCSSRGSLNFNCLLMLVPPEVCRYVVIHELCHLVHMNHSPAFWAEVKKHCPDYLQHRDWLRKQGGALIRSLP